MSALTLKHSIFQEVLFPPKKMQPEESRGFFLNKVISFHAAAHRLWQDFPIVVFDLETTGLDFRNHEIIEIGAQKLIAGQVVDEFSTLVRFDRPLPEEIIKITGITDEMLLGQPALSDVIEQFLNFIKSSLLVAHNAAFDSAFIKQACLNLGIEWTWPCYCTLKLARELLPDLERKNLDTLAKHYQLSFEARHRSIGDVKVTAEVLKQMMANEGEHLLSLADLEPYRV